MNRSSRFGPLHLSVAPEAPAGRAGVSATRLTRMSTHLDISVNGSGSTVEITLTGELDVASDRRLSETLKQVADGTTTNVVIDLRGVTLMDSAGLRWLITADALSQAEGFRLWIVRAPGAVERTLAATGMDARLPMVDRPPALGH